MTNHQRPEPSLLDIKDADGSTPRERHKAAVDFLRPKYGGSGRTEEWFPCLQLTRNEERVLARIWGFQGPSEFGNAEQKLFRMSAANGAKSVGIDKSSFKKAVKSLADKGIVVAISNGPRKPVTYQVDLEVCAKLVKEYMERREREREDRVRIGRERQQKWYDASIDSDDEDLRRRAKQQERRKDE